MSEARPVSDGDRLPWLEPYAEAPKRRAAAPRPAIKRRYSPLMIVGLVGAGALALGGYWIGRQAAPDVPGSSVTAPLPPASDSGPRLAYRSLDDRLTEPPPPPPPPAEAQAPAREAKAPQRTKRRLIRAQPRSSQLATVRRSQEAAPPSRPAPPPVRTSTMPVGKPGEVVLLGTFASPALADAARARLVTRYPYLGTLPKVIAPVAPAAGKRAVYQLKMGTGSRRNARTLCKYMLSIGRGCAVV